MPNNHWITVLTFTYPADMAIVRGRLESESIECFAADELTAQVHPFASAAIGGVKLQVRESDLPRAVEILKSTGYLTDEDLQIPEDLTAIQKVLSRIPIINKLIN
ncbi:MAG: DUF2007 domain-containing protein [Candidatus Symbiothrix sp.]|jgi:hypothetical protein|nr:DUF2007 domain-containing protein [Candidatus Symbiothrix sp.]